MCQCTSELWRFHPAYREFYEVSTCGRVRGVDRYVLGRGHKPRLWRGRVIAQSLNKDGYPVVYLCLTGKRRQVAVHKIVLETFRGPCPPEMEACHWDGNPTNNHLTNLRWGTRLDNMADRRRHGTHWQTQKLRCPLNHLLTSPNLTADSLAEKNRRCLSCKRARANRQRAQQRGDPFDFRAVADAHYRKIMSVGPEGVLAVS